MDIRKELIRIEQEKNKSTPNNTKLQEAYYKWLSGEKISDVYYNDIIDELQRGIDNKLEEKDLKMFSSTLARITKITHRPKEYQIYIDEIKNYKYFIELNSYLKENSIITLDENFTINEVNNMVYSLYDNNLLYDFLSKIGKTFCLVFEHKYPNDFNSSVSLESYFAAIVIDRDLEYKDVVVLSDYKLFIYDYNMYLNDSITLNYDYNGNIVYNFRRIEAKYFEEKNIKLYIMDNVEGTPENEKIKKQLAKMGSIYFYKDKNKFDYFIKKEKINHNFNINLSSVILGGIVDDLSKSFENRVINDLKDSPSVDFSVYSYANINNKYLIVKETIENFFKNSMYSKLKDINVWVFKSIGYDINIFINYKNIFVYFVLNSNKNIFIRNRQFFYLTKKDSINVYSKDAEKEFDFSMKNRLKSPKASVLGNAILGSVIAGPTGAMIGALTASEKNTKNLIEESKPIEPVIVKSKYKEFIITINCNNLKNQIIFRISNIDNAEYNQKFINSVAQLIENNNITIENINTNISQEEFDHIEKIKNNINELEKDKISFIQVIEKNRNALFGSKVKERKMAEIELEKSNQEIINQSTCLIDQITSILDKFYFN